MRQEYAPGVYTGIHLALSNSRTTTVLVVHVLILIHVLAHTCGSGLCEEHTWPLSSSGSASSIACSSEKTDGASAGASPTYKS